MLHLGVVFSFVRVFGSLTDNPWAGLCPAGDKNLNQKNVDSARGQLQTTNGSSEVTLKLWEAARWPFNPHKPQFLT